MRKYVSEQSVLDVLEMLQGQLNAVNNLQEESETNKNLMPEWLRGYEEATKEAIKKVELLTLCTHTIENI